MKIEEQKLIRIDGELFLHVWTDIATLEELYEVNGQTTVNVQTPQGIVPAPVNFKFMIEANSIAEAAEKLPARLQDERGNAVHQFVENLKAQERKIQIAGGDQIIPFQSRRNGQTPS